MKIYLAGPDVFRPNAVEWATNARSLCLSYGFEPLIPVDQPESAADRIFHANIDMIRKAQIIVANLDPFRGPEPDSGTVFEAGYALALGKKVIGYVSQVQTTITRVTKAQGIDRLNCDALGRPVDRNGWLVENFDLPCNLMLAVPLQIVEGGLEECLRTLNRRPL